MTSYRKSILPWIICGVSALFYCYEYLLRILPSVMTEELRLLFQMNGLALGHLIAVYYYAYIPMQLPVGILMDRVKPKKLLTFSCLACAIGSYGFAQSHLFIAQSGRFLVGLGSAFAFVGVMKLATLYLPSSKFSFIAGLTTCLGMIGAMLGDISLAHLVDSLGGYATLQIATVTGVILTVILWYVIPSTSNQIKKNSAPPQKSFTIFFSEALTLCKNPQMWLIGIIGSLLFLSLTAFAESWGIPYLRHTYQFSNETAAHYNSLVFLGWAIGSVLMGSFSEILGAKRRLTLMSFNAVLGALLFSLLLYFPNTVQPYLGAYLFCFGICSAAQIIIFPLVREMNMAMVSGTAFAVINLLVMLGGGIAQPVIGYLLDRGSVPSIENGLMVFTHQSFTYALSLLPIGFLLAACLTFFIKDPRLEKDSKTK